MNWSALVSGLWHTSASKVWSFRKPWRDAGRRLAAMGDQGKLLRLRMATRISYGQSVALSPYRAWDVSSAGPVDWPRLIANPLLDHGNSQVGRCGWCGWWATKPIIRGFEHSNGVPMEGSKAWCSALRPQSWFQFAQENHGDRENPEGWTYQSGIVSRSPQFHQKSSKFHSLSSPSRSFAPNKPYNWRFRDIITPQNGWFGTLESKILSTWMIWR